MKRLVIAALSAASALYAADIVRGFTVDLAKPRQVALPPVFHGETVDIYADFTRDGGPFVLSSSDPWTFYYQTNGMAEAWFEAPAAVSSNRVSVVWTSSMDTGANLYNCFFGAPGVNYHAAFTLRLIDSPGFAPAAIEARSILDDYPTFDDLRSAITAATNAIPRVDLTDYLRVDSEGIVADREWLGVNGDLAAARFVLGGGGYYLDGAGLSYMANGHSVDVYWPYNDAEYQTFATDYDCNLVANTAFRYTDAATNRLDTVLREEMSRISVTGEVSVVETDPTVPAWAKAETKPVYTAAETGALALDGSNYLDGLLWVSEWQAISHLNPDEIAFHMWNFGSSPPRTTVRLPIGENGTIALSSDIAAATNTLAAETATLRSAVDAWQGYWGGTNLWFEITNYQHTVAGVIPELSIRETRDGLVRTVWTDAEKFDAFAAGITNAVVDKMDSTVDLISTSSVFRAWSLYQSGTGAAAPENVTWVSTPATYLAAGYEWQRMASYSNSVWVLASNGMATNLSPDTNAFFQVATLDGETAFKIRKTDSYLIGVDPTNIVVAASTANSTTVRVDVPIVAATHPYARTSTDLRNWQMEEDGISNATISWSGSSGSYVCTATFGTGAGYLYFEYLQEGETVIENAVPVALDQGIIYGGKVYRPVVNGNKLEFVTP